MKLARYMQRVDKDGVAYYRYNPPADAVDPLATPHPVPLPVRPMCSSGMGKTEGSVVNCCDDYGNCNQGRNCPVRVAKIGKKLHGPELLPQSVWRYMLRRAAWWFFMGILGMLWLAFLVACAAYMG